MYEYNYNNKYIIHVNIYIFSVHNNSARPVIHNFKMRKLMQREVK